MLAHASEKRVCWKDTGWLTDCKDKLMSSSSERTGARAACDLGGRNLLGMRRDHHIHFLFLLPAQRSPGREAQPAWRGSGWGTLTDSPSGPNPMEGGGSPELHQAAVTQRRRQTGTEGALCCTLLGTTGDQAQQLPPNSATK